jgi:Ribosomal protein L10
MAKPEKVAAVAEISDQFRESSAAMLTEYRGLTMAQLTELRRSLGSETTYAVVKNTLTRRAAAQAGFAELEQLLNGPTAIAFVRGDPVQAAKGLRDFARTNPLLVIKGAVMEGRTLTADEVRQIADLEPREVLLAKLAGAMKAKTSQAAALFQAPLAQVARLAAALQEKQEKQATEAPQAEAAQAAEG